MMFSGMYEGRRIVSVELDDEEWREIRKAARHMKDAKLVSPITGDPMMCVQNRNGLRFFRMHPGGHDGLTEPETEHHLRLKKTVYETAKRLGYDVQMEVPGPGREWVADVLIRRPGMNPIAVEIQWSKQDEDKFQYRTERYRQAGIDCIWLYRGKGYRRSERDCWRLYGGEGPHHTDAESSWCGVEQHGGYLALPLSEIYETVRYDGAWHTAAQFVEDLLGERFRVAPLQGSVRLGTESKACRSVARPNGYPPTTFHRLLNMEKGVSGSTPDDIAEYRMGLLGWQDPDHPPTTGEVKKMRMAAIRLVENHEDLRDVPDWTASRSGVTCAGYTEGV